MAQYHATATLTNGAATLTIAGDVTAEIDAGDIMIRSGEGVPYHVAIEPTYSAPNTTVTLTANYAGTSGSATVTFERDFVAVDTESLPLLYRGDIETPAVYTRAMTVIAGLFNALIAGTRAFTAVLITGGKIHDVTTIVDPADTTKAARLDAGNVTAGQTRVLTMPDADVDLADFVDTTTFHDPAAATKKVRLDAGNVTAGQTRVLTMPDADVTITPASASILDDLTTAAILATLGAEPTLLWEHEVTGSAVTSVQITGLDIDTHKSYRLECAIVNASGSAITVGLYVNGDTTATNYYSQVINGSGTTATLARSNAPTILGLAASENAIAVCDIALDASDYFRFMSRETRYAAASVEASIRHGAKTATTANITQADIISSVANSIGPGSRFRLYRGDK